MSEAVNNELLCEWCAGAGHDYDGNSCEYCELDRLKAEYARLEQECERLRNQRDAILLQARTWACEAKTQQSITQEVSEALGGIPTWGPIAETVSNRLAERDDALKQVEEMRHALERAKEWLQGWASAEPQLAVINAALSAKPCAPTK